jgi:Mrp family chromosome partitioning ATPase
MTRMLEALRQIDDRLVFPIPSAVEAPALVVDSATAPAVPEESCPATAEESCPAIAEPEPELEPEPAAPSPDTARDCPPECAAAAARILQDFPPGRPGALWFASPEPAGRATAAVASLAAALACQVTGEILLVDGDLRFPGLAQHFSGTATADSPDGLGFVDVLLGRSCWEDVIRRTGIRHLDLLPGRILGDEESSAAGAAQWGAVLSDLRRAYQLVLIDGPAIGDFAAEPAVRCADAVYLVIGLGRTGRRATRRAVAALREAGARVLGCVGYASAQRSPFGYAEA